MSVLDKLKKHFDTVFSSIGEKDVSNSEIDRQLKKNNLNIVKNNNYNSFFEQELKSNSKKTTKITDSDNIKLEVVSDLNSEQFSLIKKKSSPEQDRLNQFIIRDNKFKIFKMISYNNVNNIVLIKEAINLERHLRKQKFKITPKHLREVGLIKDNEINFDIREEEYEDDEYQKEQERHFNRYANPMARHIQENITENILSKRHQERNEKYHSKIEERRKAPIYDDNKSSMYKNAIEEFLKNNKDFYQDKKENTDDENNNDKDFEDEDFFDDLLDLEEDE